MSWNFGGDEEGGGGAPAPPPAPFIETEDFRLLPELEQIERYVMSDIPVHRLVQVKNIAAACRRAGASEARRVALPLLPRIFADVEFVIRHTMADELPKLCRFLIDCDDPASRENYNYVCEQLIPQLHKLLLDSAVEVRASAGHALYELARMLDPLDMEQRILTSVLCLAHDDFDEHRATAVSVLHELAPALGCDLCRSFLSHELVAMSEDPSFRVRKATAAAFSNICQTVGPEYAVQRLLPAFLKLSKDSIWGVRKACVDNMIGIANCMSLSVRMSVFVPIFEQFSKDISRWVRNAAYEILGPFLATLDTSTISSEMLKKFTKIPSLTNAVVDPEVSFHCAFNFPAVLKTVGAERWPEMVESFRLLVKDAKFKVRRTLSHSLHELAIMLGSQSTLTHLLPVFHVFLRDIDDVKEFMEVCWQLQQENDQNWRLRKLLAHQAGDLCSSFPADSFIRMVVSMLHDRVATVRQAILSCIGRIFGHLLLVEAEAAEELKIASSDASSSSVTPAAIAELEKSLEARSEAVLRLTQELAAFASGRSCQERQLFARASEVCWAGPHPIADEDLKRHMLPLLLPLAKDRVANVRLAVARAIHAGLTAKPHFFEDAGVRHAVELLRQDSDKDVSFFFTVEVIHTWADAHLQWHADSLLEETDAPEYPVPAPTASTPTPFWQLPGASMAPAFDADADADAESASVPASSTSSFTAEVVSPVDVVIEDSSAVVDSSESSTAASSSSALPSDSMNADDSVVTSTSSSSLPEDDDATSAPLPASTEVQSSASFSHDAAISDVEASSIAVDSLQVDAQPQQEQVSNPVDDVEEQVQAFEFNFNDESPAADAGDVDMSSFSSPNSSVTVVESVLTAAPSESDSNSSSNAGSDVLLSVSESAQGVSSAVSSSSSEFAVDSSAVTSSESISSEDAMIDETKSDGKLLEISGVTSSNDAESSA